uniref:Exonuclease domain-containing protein n=1 Tax=Syphacia muris TaxID=451379 RepID=A0A0N5AA26_9BILA
MVSSDLVEKNRLKCSSDNLFINDDHSAAGDDANLKFIDDLPSSENSPPECYQHLSYSDRKIKKQKYTQGNIVQEAGFITYLCCNILLFSMDDKVRESSKMYESCKRPVCSGGDSSSRNGSGKRSECDENSFSHTVGQLLLYNDKQGSYNIQNTPPAVGTYGSCETSQTSPEALFLDTLPHSDFKPLELRHRLTPSKSARLSPASTASPKEGDMTNNCKSREMEEKHCLARQRRTNRKAKGTKNLNKPGDSKDYMIDLATEEILRKLGEDVKSVKPKKNQKSSIAQKDGTRSAKTGGGNGKKSRDKLPQLDKEANKGSGGSSNSPSPSPKHHKPNAEKNSDIRVHSTDLTSDMNNKNSSVFSAIVGAGEDEDEEQYVSADEGVNSVASDEVYHTDELSVSSSHDLMNDAGNYRADDEEVALNKCTAEEPEFIQVTTKNKKKAINNAYADKKNSTGSNETTSSSRQSLVYTDIKQRRNSGQVAGDVSSGHANHLPLNDHKKFTGSLARRQLNSLADYIEDSTVRQGKTKKNAHHANPKVAASSNQPFKSNTTSDNARNKNGHTETFDRRNSQPAYLSGRYAAAVIHNTQENILIEQLVFKAVAWKYVSAECVMSRKAFNVESR